MTNFWGVVAAVAGATVGLAALAALVATCYIIAKVTHRIRNASRVLREMREAAAAAGSGGQGEGFGHPSMADTDHHAAPSYPSPLAGDIILRPSSYTPEHEAASETGIETYDDERITVRKVKYKDMTDDEKRIADEAIDREMEASARKAVDATGLSGPDAARLYKGIMAGIAKAKREGKNHGTIAVTLSPGALMDPVGVRLMPSQPGFRADASDRVVLREQILDFTDDKPVS